MSSKRSRQRVLGRVETNHPNHIHVVTTKRNIAQLLQRLFCAMPDQRFIIQNLMGGEIMISPSSAKYRHTWFDALSKMYTQGLITQY